MNQEEIKRIFCKPVSERALLSFCFKDVSNFYTLSQKLTETDFLHPNHPPLFSIFKVLSSNGVERFDMAMVMNTAKDNYIIENVGGFDYIQSIANMIDSLSQANFDNYLKDIIEASTKYKLHMRLSNNLADIVENAKKGKDSAELIGAIENEVLELSTESKAVIEPRNIFDGLEEYIEERRKNPVSMVGLSTGFAILNAQIDGLIPGTLFVISARKKVGKSAFLTNMATHIAFNERKTVLYIDTELSFEEWRTRVIAGMSGVEERIIKHGGYTKEQYDRIINKCLRLVEKGSLYHEYMPGYTVDKIVALYKKYAAKYDLGCGIFDYLKEPDSNSIERNRKEYQVLGDVTTKLKDIAGVLNIPMATAVQLNRKGDIADSDRIARYGDIIAQWASREDKDREECPRGGSHKLIIKDTRRGGSTSDEGIGYWFFKEYLRIREVAPHDQQINYKSVVNKDSATIERDFYDEEDLL